MSNLHQRKLSFAGLDVTGLADDDLRALVREIRGLFNLDRSPKLWMRDLFGAVA